MHATTDPTFEITSTGLMDIEEDYLSKEMEPEVAGKDLIADYVKWYYESDSSVRDDKYLDFSKFMEYSYDLSEKAAPFLDNCDIGKDEVCQEFMDEAYKQWDIIKLEKKLEKDQEPPKADRVRFYLDTYHDYHIHNAQKDVEKLDFDLFLQFVYDLSEKAEPFLFVCDPNLKENNYNELKEFALKEWKKIIKERGPW